MAIDRSGGFLFVTGSYGFLPSLDGGVFAFAVDKARKVISEVPGGPQLAGDFPVAVAVY